MPTSARLFVARALAWALLLSGWVALGQGAQWHLPGQAWPQAFMALWLLVLAGVAPALVSQRLRAAAGPVAAGALGLTACAWAAGAPVLGWVAVVWAAGIAVALRSVGRCRAVLLAAGARPGSPVVAAAAGAVVAGVLLGDPGDPQALMQRLPWAMPLMGAVGALLPWGLPAAVGRGGGRFEGPGACGAGLLACALPSLGGWRGLPRAQWPLRLAPLAMLPMMAALPGMLALCRSGGWSAPAMLALHALAMFGPAWLLPHLLQRWPSLAQQLPGVVAGLLASAWLPLLWPHTATSAAMVLATVTQGAAWSLAWGLRMQPPPVARPAAPGGLAAAAVGGTGAVPAVGATGAADAAKPAAVCGATGGAPPGARGAARRWAGQAAWLGCVGAVLSALGPSGLLPLQAAIGAVALAAWLSGVVAVTGRVVPAAGGSPVRHHRPQGLS